MRLFHDRKEPENNPSSNYTSKEEGISDIVHQINALHENKAISDIMVIVRTKETEPGPEGIPQNVVNGTSVDTELEATVFMRFAVDMLFDRMKYIAISDFIKEIKTK